MKLFVGICNSQPILYSDFFWSFLSIRIPSTCKVMVHRSIHPWDAVRNNWLIDKFLKSDCNCFVKMDVDQGYPSDYFKIMLPLLQTHDVIGPMIYDRHADSGFMPLCFERDENEPYAKRGKPFDNKTGIMELPYLHTNCFYNRYVLEAIKPPYYEAYLSESGLERANHVDFTFMSKVRDAGFKIYINFDVVVEHIAHLPISREVYERWNK